MQTNEFYVHTKGCALGFTSLACDIYKDSDDYEEILDELNDMDLTQFMNIYPNVYEKYFVEKMIKSSHVIIYYHFPLFAQISKIYVSQDGFTIAEIASIIKAQYKKFYKNREMATNLNQIPKYISKDAYNLHDLYLRFHINYEPLNLTKHNPHPKCDYHINTDKLPTIFVGCDT